MISQFVVQYEDYGSNTGNADDASEVSSHILANVFELLDCSPACNQNRLKRDRSKLLGLQMETRMLLGPKSRAVIFLFFKQKCQISKYLLFLASEM